MNFIVSSSTLLKRIQSISGVLTTNNTLPILDNFLFEISDNSLRISASDIETTMNTVLEVESNEGGTICVPADILSEILKSLPDQPLTFSINQENFEIEITYSNGKSKMVGYNGDDFPKLKAIEETQELSINGRVLAEAINKTIFATSNDDLRPVMGGVFCQMTQEDATFVATDAHKLVRYKRNDVNANGNSSFILPKKALNLLRNNLNSIDEGVDVKIGYNVQNALFHFNNTELVCRLIEGKYPNYEAVIPKENPNVLTIDRMEFLNTIKRISIFANKTTRQVLLKITGSELEISAEDLDFSNAAKERLTCNYNGEDIEIGFNSRFLIEMLQNIDSTEIMLKMSQPNRAGILVPSPQKNENTDLLMLIMPVMVGN